MFKLLLTDEGTSKSRNTLVENDELITKDKELSDHFSQFLKMLPKIMISKGIIHLYQAKAILLILSLRNFIDNPSVRSIKENEMSGFFLFSKQRLMSFKKKSID